MTTQLLSPSLMRISVASQRYKESCAPLPEIFEGPRIATLEYRVLPEVNAGADALARGEIDLLDFAVDSTSGLGPDITLDPCRDFGFHYIACNNRVGLTRWTAFRKAIAYLADCVKRQTAAMVETDRIELMQGMMVQYYGRLVNRYLPGYTTTTPDDALTKALSCLKGFTVLRDRIIDPEGVEVPRGSVRCLVPAEDAIGRDIMQRLEELLCRAPALGGCFSFETLSRNEIAERVYREGSDDWHLFVGWNYVQDNLSRWNPGMSKLRLSLCWMADFQSDNSYTRNYVGFRNAEYDRCAMRFLTTLQPRDLRGAVITEHHLDPSWNNAEFWIGGAPIPAEANALLLLWKLQWILADEVPIIPLFARSVRFARRSDVEGIWNGDPEESFTYPGGERPVVSTYPGGTMSYWTFQRVHKSDEGNDRIVLGISNRLRHLNPLGVGNYWDALVWSRIYESLLGLNPFLLMKGVAEDAVNLASSFFSEVYRAGSVRQRLHFDIRPDVFWHDGEILTSADVAYTFLSLLGAHGREVARRHGTSEGLHCDLVNDVPIPSWIDFAKWIEHIEIPDEMSVDVYLSHSSRYPHEWFGDMPIIPRHVWMHLGHDFTNPSYQDRVGLYNIRDHSRIAPRDKFCGWHGLVGTGPFVWREQNVGQPPESSLVAGGCLDAFPAYHNSII